MHTLPEEGVHLKRFSVNLAQIGGVYVHPGYDYVVIPRNMPITLMSISIVLTKRPSGP